MGAYKLQFGPEDVAAKMREAYEQEKGHKMPLTQEMHSMLSPLNFLKSHLYLLLETCSLEPLNNSGQMEHFREMLQLMENIYVCSNDLIREAASGKPTIKIAEKYCKEMDKLADCFPAFENLLGADALSAGQMEEVKELDNAGKLAFYSISRLFSPHLNGDFYLHLDDDAFSEATKRGGANVTWKIRPIRTRADYLSYAMLPIFWNAIEHAFNPENDVYDRLKTESCMLVEEDGERRPFFLREISISGSPENDSCPGNYIVGIGDNGFGIRPEHAPHIFERGFTTKPKDGMEHGIGLLGVKEFVERNGGRIGFQTELGRGTEFEFTIPYSRKEGDKVFKVE